MVTIIVRRGRRGEVGRGRGRGGAGVSYAGDGLAHGTADGGGAGRQLEGRLAVGAIH